MGRLKTRKPTGKAPWPLILVEGAEKAGKSYACAQLSASKKVGRVLYFDLGEHAADQYSAIPGASYEVIIHDGTYGSILEQLQAAVDEVAPNDEAPAVLVFDSISNLWSLLVDEAQASANKRKKNRRAGDDDAQITMDLWNTAKSRWRGVMDTLIAFHGIAIVTARGRSVMDVENGKPTNREVWKVEGEKSLCFDVDVWVRLNRDEPPALIGARSLKCGVRPGVDKPVVMRQFSLEALVFDALGLGGDMGKRDFVELTPEDEAAAPSPAPKQAPAKPTKPPKMTENQAKARLWNGLAESRGLDKDDARDITFRVWERASLTEFTPEAIDALVAEDALCTKKKKHVFALLGECDLPKDAVEAARHAILRERYSVESMNDLDSTELADLIEHLNQLDVAERTARLAIVATEQETL